ncbi:MAG: Hsp70 family protein [Erysipelotrichaceae bacterium]|nr:Hsp70 family protein [Erysipelotrichaceae bacterium]
MMDFFTSEGSSIGIDLGTQNSVIVKFNGKNDYTFLKENERCYVNSSLFFNTRNNYDFGTPAKRKGMMHPESLLRCFKRGLSGNNTGHIENGRYRITCYENKEIIDISPREACSIFLKNLIDDFNEENDEIQNLVLTVPAKFGPDICEALRRGAMGFVGDVVIVQEPIAAAICYDYEEEKIENNSSLLVYDFGAGTFDISLLKRNNQGNLEYIDTNGDVHLGGEDLTEAIYLQWKDDLFINEDFDLDNQSLFKDENEHEYNIGVLKNKAEEAKILLSSEEKYDEPIVFRMNDQKVQYNLTITRNQFNNLISRHITHSIDKIKTLLARNQMTQDDISKVLVVGGTSFIPLIKTKLIQYFGSEDKIVSNVDKELMIGKGAAIIAHEIYEENQEDLKGAISYSGIIQKVSDTIGIALGTSHFVNEIIPRGAQLPYKTTYRCPLIEARNSNGCIDISFHSYDQWEFLKNDTILTYDNRVDYIGKRVSDKVNGNDHDQVEVLVEINNQFIINVSIRLNNTGIDNGPVRKDDL